MYMNCIMHAQNSANRMCSVYSIHAYIMLLGKALTEALSEAEKIGIAFGVIVLILVLLLCIVIILVFSCFTKQRNEKSRLIISQEVKESKSLPEIEKTLSTPRNSNQLIANPSKSSNLSVTINCHSCYSCSF